MRFIAEYWWLWAMLMASSYGYALVKAVYRARRFFTPLVVSAFSAGDIRPRMIDTSPNKEDFYTGIGKIIVSAAVGSVGFVLLIIATAYNIIH